MAVIGAAKAGCMAQKRVIVRGHADIER